ncbi:MAG: YigZ family protein [Bacteroidia bacterium]|nr:YigZ family protein [Bacteroidia bacterium]
MKADSYRTITKPSDEVLLKEKNSKFFGYVYPVTTEEDVKGYLEDLKSKHTNAGHFCYAYVVGIEDSYHRFSDDGEPSNSAGAPIFGQIQHFDLTNVLVVVVRYFGGTKLGVGGLISTYKQTAKLALQSCKIAIKYHQKTFEIIYPYESTNWVMRMIQQNQLKIQTQEFKEQCRLVFLVRQKESKKVLSQFKSQKEILINEL